MSFWRPDIIRLDQLIDRVLLGFGAQTEITSPLVIGDQEAASKESRKILSKMNVSRITDQIDQDALALNKVKLELLNGYGIKGAASEAGEFFKSQGYIIARIENAASFGYEETVIIDWNRDVKNAIDIAEFIKIDPSRIIVYDKKTKPIDLTIVLGKDWPALYKSLDKRLNKRLNNESSN
jgi:hypothetical protein